VGTGAHIMTAGFVTGGARTSGAQTVLIRGSGPALGLAPFNLAGALPDPQLTLNDVSASAGTVVATDTGWGGAAQISSAASAVGAFPWNPSSADSAVLRSLPPANYTAQIQGASGDTGVALVEVYDATPSGTYTPASPRLTNLSALIQVGTGANVVFAGFVVGGSTAKTVLIRASGPALGVVFGISGSLPDPQLTLTNVSASPNAVITVNTGWGADPQVLAAIRSTGAFPWGSSATADSAVLVTLPPGNYTAGVAGASGDTGLSLIELYEVP